MTTQIIVNAHCGSDKEVRIKIKSDTEDEIILQDGKTIDNLLVYDDREISIKEVVKKTDPTPSEQGATDTGQGA